MQDANKPSQSAQKLVKLDLSIQVQVKVNGIHSVIDKFGKDARILTAPKDATYVHSTKYYIICHPDLATLNKRSELASGCRHANKFLLKKF